MKAIVLAAGRGSRMSGMTDDRPKCMIELAGRPLINWQLSALRDAGFRAVDIAIVTGYLGDRVVAPNEAVRFENTRWSKTNMVMSLVCAAPWLRAHECFVSYADIVYPASTVTSLCRSDADIAIAFDPDWSALWQQRFEDPLEDAERFDFSDDDFLIDIGSPATSIEAIKGQYMGLLRFSPQGWSEVESELSTLSDRVRDSLDMTTLLRRLLDREVPIRTVRATGSWGEVDSGSDLALYEHMIKLGAFDDLGSR